MADIIAFAKIMKALLKVNFHTLGCKLNQAESEALAQQFTEAGYHVVDGGRADVCIVNTCTVTHIADRKSRQLLRSLRRRNPGALVVALGCYAERAPVELANIGGIDLIIDNTQKMDLLQLLKGNPAFASSAFLGQSGLNSTGRVRSFVKVQEGCNDFCTYCIVPEVRGRERCLSVGEVVSQVKARVALGYKEIILTGTKVGSYQYNGANLEQLIENILAKTTVERLHISSLQPHEITPGILALWQDPRLCHHFHMALQSGSNDVLARMGRRYSNADYGMVVSSIREGVPAAAITTDIMVGFPGESNNEFEESYCFCCEMGFANIHVFTYSPRPGTQAAKMPGQIGDRLKKERSQRMLALARESASKFHERFLGQTAQVLWEKEVTSGTGLYSGLSNNYIRTFTKSHLPLTNKFLPVQLVHSYGQGLYGESIG